MSDDLVARVQQLDEEGRQRFGDEWSKYIDAIGRANPSGIAPEAWRQILARQDAADLVVAGGREALVNMATNGDKEAEYTYGKIREQERQNWRRYKGR